MRFAVFCLGISAVYSLTLPAWSQQQYDEPPPAVSAALARRIVPLEITTPSGTVVDSMYVLTEDVLVQYGTEIPASAASAPRLSDLVDSLEPYFRALGQRCGSDHESWFFDGTFLLPGETAEDFYQNNLHFFVSSEDQARFKACRKRWTGAYIREHPGKGFVWTSPDRVIDQLKLWAKYLASGRTEDRDRAVDLFVYSLNQQQMHLAQQIEIRDLKILAKKINSYDEYLYSTNIEILELNLPFDKEDEAIIREYFGTEIQVRHKLLSQYPEQIKRLVKSQRLLAKFAQD